jgi:hypothetical protein
MNPLDRTAIEDLILNSTHRETADSGGQSLRLAVEVAIPVLLGLGYLVILFLCCQP